MDKFGNKFGTSFQIKIISALLSDRIFLQTVYDILKPEAFDSEANEWLVKIILKHFDEFSKLPTLDVFKVEIDKVQRDVLKQSVLDNLKQVWNQIESDDLEYVKEQTLEFCKNQNFKGAILESVQLLEEGKFDVIKEKIDNAMKSGQDTDIGHEYKLDVKARYESNIRNVIPTGWDVIDELVDGGFGKGELILFAAPPGIGKSWALINVGMAAVKAGKTVVHYTLELNEGYVGQRYDAILTGTAVPNLKYNIEEVERQVSNLSGELIVKYWPTKSAGLNAIRASLDKLTLQGKKPDVIICDYADLLLGNSRKERHEELEELVEGLRGIAGEYECPLYTASQINRSGADADVITGTSIAGSFSKLMTADFVVSLSRKIEDKLAGTGRWHVIKNRFGPDGMTLPSKANMSNGRMSIYSDDSVDGKQTQSDMNKGESLVRKNLLQKYNELKTDIDF
jgi:replicative DNA helicase|tara:strand:+ start:3239 stop:4597 length:1359 start_codon:yes stop_codon:yes gene_type:complete